MFRRTVARAIRTSFVIPRPSPRLCSSAWKDRTPDQRRRAAGDRGPRTDDDRARRRSPVRPRSKTRHGQQSDSGRDTESQTVVSTRGRGGKQYRARSTIPIHIRTQRRRARRPVVNFSPTHQRIPCTPNAYYFHVPSMIIGVAIIRPAIRYKRSYVYVYEGISQYASRTTFTLRHPAIPENPTRTICWSLWPGGFLLVD